MALTSGFFNAVKNDRRYNAEQMSEIFDGIITDGILANIGQHFAVTTASNGLQINVGTGRAWFDHTWTKNDSVMVLTVEQPDISRDRIDAVVLEVNHDDAVRDNSIYIVKGTASVNPQKPELPNSDKVKLYPLAYITVKVDATEIKAEDIENAIGLTPCPFATGILQTTPIDELWEQWRGEWNTWFANIKLQLTEDVVTNLQYQIEELRERLNSDGIDSSQSVLDQLGIPANSSVSDALIYLDKQTKALVQSILNMGSFVKTGDYTSSGTFTHTMKGTNAKAIIIGGGGGGGGGGGSPSGSYYGHYGGYGGSPGSVVIKDSTSVSKGGGYQVVVGIGGTGGKGGTIGYTNVAGSNGGPGGTSSVLDTTAKGGTGGSASQYLDISGARQGQNGSAGSSYSVEGVTGTTGSGGQGSCAGRVTGAYGTVNTNPLSNLPGGSGINGSGSGGYGGGGYTSKNSYDETIFYFTNGGAGGNATSYGSGGGGGGSSAFPSTNGGIIIAGGYGQGGAGGNGKNGRVVIFESGVFNG